MRYVCTDTLKPHDIDQGTRRVIDQAIVLYAKDDRHALSALLHQRRWFK